MASSCLKFDLRSKAVFPKNFIHQRPHPMDIFITDLDENGAGVGEEIAGDSETVAEVGEVAVDAVAPSVAEGFNLLRFAGDVVGLAVLDVAAGGGPLEVGVELDAVRRIEVDALDFPAQAFALGEGRHNLKGIPRIMRFCQWPSCL